MKLNIPALMWPRTLFGQTVLILVIGLTVSHVVSFLIYESEKMEVVDLVEHGQIAERISTIASLVIQSDGDERRRIIKAVNGPTLRVSLSVTSEIVDGTDHGSRLLREALELRMTNVSRHSFRVNEVKPPKVGLLETLRHIVNLGDNHHSMREHLTLLGKSFSKEPTIRASMRLQGGRWLNFSTSAGESLVSLTPHFFLSMIIMLGGVIAFSLWAVWRMTAPLKEFTYAAERLGKNLDDTAVSGAGSAEVSRASEAFNSMHARVKQFVEDRTQMIAAISHDLRTPLTRLRFRSELIADKQQREKFVRDIEEMQTMITAALAFAREDACAEASRAVDLVETVRQIGADMSELGQDISIEGPSRAVIQTRPSALRRSLANIIDNAVRYGGHATVRIREERGQVRILVEDNGPGLPDDQLEDVFRPFVRLERSRNKDVAGVGLGLSAALNVVRAQGGDIVLRNRDEGGLSAEVRLPR